MNCSRSRHTLLPALLLAASLLAIPVRAQDLLHELVSPNEEEGGAFGAVSGVPDVDGDGWGDLLVGAPLDSPGASPDQAGRAYVFSGASGALLHELTSPNEEEDGHFSLDVAAVPDVDGDGRGDLLVGAQYEDPGTSPETAGRAYVFSGASGLLLHELVSPNEEGSGHFGAAVSGVPDVDGDGRGDLLIGAYQEGTASGEAGRAYVFSGASGFLLHELVSPNVEENDAFFGAAVSGVPDVDGDGRGDLLVGAHLEDPGGLVRAGRAYVFSGATGALLHELTSPNPEHTGLFGGATSGIPDVDGDARGDLLVGAWFEGPGPSPIQAGRAYVFSGATGVLLHELASPNEAGGGWFGSTVSGVEDLDRDGRGDLLIGTWEDATFESAGRAYAFSGATGTLLYQLVSPNQEDFGYFGTVVSGVPDVDGDGRGDLLVGAEGEDGGEEDAGRAYLFSGGLTPTAIEEEPRAALVFQVPRPNPFAEQATLAFELPSPSPVRLAVYDVLGREVAVVVNGVRPVGRHEVVLDGRRLPAGAYVVRLEAVGQVRTQRLTLVR